MKEIIEKQILEWQQELLKQKEAKENAERVISESSQNILVLTGGIQFGQAQIKKYESENNQNTKIGESKNQKK
tara:strand:+ start:4130 stop:4348 length:219 start_codon:yes stop_codon:yes gene_type:complete